MGTGYLKIQAYMGDHALPVSGAMVTVRDAFGTVCETVTDEDGISETVQLWAPDAVHTLDPNSAEPKYAVCTASVSADGYESVTVHGIQIFDTQTAILPVEMVPKLQARAALSAPTEIAIPAHDLSLTQPLWIQQSTVESPQIAYQAIQPTAFREVVIPDEITVHLGAPNANARNVRVPFTDYIKNVASGEIYPTWPEAALEANIYCQISFALNRVYTEWYTSRGYPFHITGSTSYDQTYVDGRNIFESISRVVDRIFNIYVRRQGFAEPYFTQFCNGTTVTCAGLSQWGTVGFANQGMNAYQILRRYYPADIELVESTNIGGITESYPGYVLRQGSTGDEVRLIQQYLNRIRINYPGIPQIANPNGTFGSDTTAAVRVFQQTFSLTADGLVGRATWYKIVSIYTAVKKLADLESEGEVIGVGRTPPSVILRQGSRGTDVLRLQFLLNFLAEFYSELPLVLENSVFDSYTLYAVQVFQRTNGLTQDGIVGAATWNRLYALYWSIQDNLQPPTVQPEKPAYPGTLIREGARGENVLLMQRYLNAVCRGDTGYSVIAEDAIFGPKTKTAVIFFQRKAGLAQDGIIGPLTWNALVSAYHG